MIAKAKKTLKRINSLNQNGKLVKNLPFHIEDTNTTVNGVQGIRIVVDYNMPNGTVVTLKGDPRYDGKISDSDNKVDLVIDENDPEKYYIDFEINRISGNKPEDYYVDPYDMSNSTQSSETAPTESTPAEPTPAPNTPPVNKI